MLTLENLDKKDSRDSGRPRIEKIPIFGVSY